MKIAVLGTGMVGKTIAQRLNNLGHNVIMGTRSVAETLEKPLKEGQESMAAWLSNTKGIRLETFDKATAEAEIVFNCTSGQASLAALEAAGANNLAGKVLIDIANPLDFSQGMPPTLNPVNDDSLSEQIQKAFPESRVVKTLNTMTASVMVNPALLQGPHTVFLSGNDADAKDAAKELLTQFGWKAENMLDLGDISTARGTEMFLPLWIRMWGALGTAQMNIHIQR